MDKLQLAHQIKRVIREWGQTALAFQEGKISETWFHSAKRQAQERLVLYSGALAGMIIGEVRQTPTTGE